VVCRPGSPDREGTHTDHIGQRFDEVVLPFFGEHLDAATTGSGERG